MRRKLEVEVCSECGCQMHIDWYSRPVEGFSPCECCGNTEYVVVSFEIDILPAFLKATGERNAANTAS